MTRVNPGDGPTVTHVIGQPALWLWTLTFALSTQYDIGQMNIYDREDPLAANPNRVHFFFYLYASTANF